MPILGAIPVKPFQSAKGRLGSALDADTRSEIGRLLARQTVEAATGAGIRPLVLAADAEVTSWASAIGVASSPDEGQGLNQAARKVLGSDQTWIVIHADLPWITASALARVVGKMDEGPVIVASPDGGTPVVGWKGDDFVFSYGPGSFHLHLRQLAWHRPSIVVDPRLGFDLDLPRHLSYARLRNRELELLLSTLPVS